MSRKVWQVSQYIIPLIIAISLLASMAGCSNGWITPNEVNKSYDFSDLEQTVLAYYEAINNNDMELFIYIFDFPGGKFGDRLKQGMIYKFKRYDPENQRVLKYRIDKINQGEGFASVDVSLQVKDYDRIFETSEPFDFTKINDEWKSKGFLGFPWSTAQASAEGQ